MDWFQFEYLVVMLPIALLLCFLITKKSVSLFAAEGDCASLSEKGVLFGLVAIGSAIVYWNYIVGNNYFVYADIGSDTQQQYLPFYLDLIHDIRSGSFSLWDYNYGLGASRLCYQSWLFDPFNLILVPVGLLFGDSSLPSALIAVQIMKVVVCAGLFHRFACFFSNSPVARVFGALVFAFNGFLMLWGSHYWFGNACIGCVALLLGVESLLRRASPARFSLLALIVALIIVWSVYVGFMIMLTGAVYTLLRCAYIAGNAREFGRLILPIAVSVVSGCLLSGLVFFPSAYLLLSDSARISSGDPLAERAIGALLSFVDVPESFIMLGRAMGNNLTAVGTEVYPYLNYYEFIQIGCSAGIFLFLFQYCRWAVKGERGLRRKILLLFPVVMIMVYVCNHFLPQLYNLMVAVSYRSSFAICVAVCMMMTIVVEQVFLPRKASLSLLGVSYLFSMGVICFSAYTATRKAQFVCAVFGVLLTVSFLLLVVYQKRSVAKELLFAALLLLWGTSIFDAFVTTNVRVPLTKDNFPVSEMSGLYADTESALDAISKSDDGLYRIEKTYSDWTWEQDSFVQHYSGVSSYNSSLSKGLTAFFHEMWPEVLTGANNAHQSVAANIDNPSALGFLGVKYILSRSIMDYDWCEYVARYGDVYVYRNEYANEFGKAYSLLLSEEEADAMASSERSQVLDDHAIVSVGDLNRLGQAVDGEGSSVPSSVALEKKTDGCFEGTILLSSDAFVVVPLPASSGWSVFVDGEQVESFVADYGFIGFVVPEGRHSALIVYAPYGWQVGAIMSAIGLLIVLAYWLAFRLREKKHERKTAKMVPCVGAVDATKNDF